MTSRGIVVIIVEKRNSETSEFFIRRFFRLFRSRSTLSEPIILIIIINVNFYQYILPNNKFYQTSEELFCIVEDITKIF